jgi:molecular chaperone IbpA
LLDEEVFMTTALALSPLFRQTVGFDRFNDLFESLVRGDEGNVPAYPPYNIEKHGEGRYHIVMAVAGFRQDELTITAHQERLTIAGAMQERAAEGVEFLHRGIAARAFERSFRLADHMKVVAARLEDGLLTIELLREVPEEAKPRTIAIQSASIPMIDGKKAK